jgi:DNA-binding NtrC family response regulator
MDEVDLVNSQPMWDPRVPKVATLEVRVRVDPARSYGELKEELVSSFEAQLIKVALDRNSGNVSAAAKSLRMDRKHFYDLAVKHGLRSRPVKGEPKSSPTT